LERSFHGRPAGFRTHTLVCLASSLLMLVTLYQAKWIPGGEPGEIFRTDPTRMAQGIMTGIGFLGAGVIFKEGLSVRGLTTAASIWMTAAIGVLLGIGFYFPASLATLLTLGRSPSFAGSRLACDAFVRPPVLRFDRDNVLEDRQCRDLLRSHGFSVANMTYRLVDGGNAFEYRMIIRTADESSTPRLAETLRRHSAVREFRISPTGD
jgi:putative Mg2+ transporter-C (MgtC) family protein